MTTSTSTAVRCRDREYFAIRRIGEEALVAGY
jgi:hypothetical protein